MSNEKETKEFIENAGRRHEERLNATFNVGVDPRIGSTDELVEVIAKTGPRWSELAGVDEIGSGAYRKRSTPVEARPDVPPYCMPVKANTPTVEVLPGVLVSQHTIDEAVKATSEPGAEARIEQRETAKQKFRDEVKRDLGLSKKIIKSMIEQIQNPPNMKEKYISFDAMPSPLQRVVKAYVNAAEANKELDEAIKALAAEPRTSS